MNRNSRRLSLTIEEQIAQSQLRGRVSVHDRENAEVSCISFHDYMAICLYDEKEGYYRSGDVRVGKKGDFYTSSAIGSIMGEKLASCAAELANCQKDSVVRFAEWGAGTGLLSEQMIAAWSSARHSWLSQVQHYIVDSNPVHLEAAQSRLELALADLDTIAAPRPQLHYVTPQEAKNVMNETTRSNGAASTARPYTIIIANELLDAFPVHRVVMKEGRLWELGVAVNVSDDEEVLRYVYTALTDERIAMVLHRDGIELLEGQITEVNLAAEQWITELGQLVEHGALLLVDYGHEVPEITASHRMHGTLLCYKDHMAHDRPFILPGEQDMTSHINFTACRHAAEQAGWQVQYYDTQKQFLLDQGLLQDLVAHDGTNPFSEAARRNRSIRQLLLSDNMSESFKVMVLVKGV
ncbi:class I SAM-dependent methyltransferase [Paenibacillus sp. CF384]|uniref:class I SAM-dependent methyltransferase n=1 Tax=Paenibacillus sp. CF384 TaxID=1884382 RepID=UPI00089887A7|nr:SAM-dependent methyltransferase [Paenibacillus sp. CF384]SDW87397.1 SAM-dependent methyltransferase, MidA family [Paenibacillus sp. CF384]